MANTANSDDLDGILDEALEAFETVPDAKSSSQGQNDDTGASAAKDQTSQNPREADNPVEFHSTDHALQEALKSLSVAEESLEGAPDDLSKAEDDIKLVEEFVQNLSSTLGNSDDFPLPMEGGSGSERPPNANGDDNLQTAERLVDSIVKSLLSEDVLKKPMMEMRSAYAKWLEQNKDTLPAQELARYRQQESLVKEICQKYESNANSSEIMETLSKIHGTGEPPAEVIKSLDAGSTDSLPEEHVAELDKFAEQCGVQ